MSDKSNQELIIDVEILKSEVSRFSQLNKQKDSVIKGKSKYIEDLKQQKQECDNAISFLHEKNSQLLDSNIDLKQQNAELQKKVEGYEELLNEFERIIVSDPIKHPIRQNVLRNILDVFHKLRSEINQLKEDK